MHMNFIEWIDKLTKLPVSVKGQESKPYNIFLQQESQSTSPHFDRPFGMFLAGCWTISAPLRALVRSWCPKRARNAGEDRKLQKVMARRQEKAGCEPSGGAFLPRLKGPTHRLDSWWLKWSWHVLARNCWTWCRGAQNGIEALGTWWLAS